MELIWIAGMQTKLTKGPDVVVKWKDIPKLIFFLSARSYKSIYCNIDLNYSPIKGGKKRAMTIKKYSTENVYKHIAKRPAEAQYKSKEKYRMDWRSGKSGLEYCAYITIRNYIQILKLTSTVPPKPAAIFSSVTSVMLRLPFSMFEISC